MTSKVPAGRSVVVEVPATTANLGPGFDTLGLALSVYDRLTVTASDVPGVRVEVHGVGAGEVPTDETNLVAQAILRVFAEVGEEAPGLDLIARNTIPHGRGLGSSGAAVVSGIVAAKGLLEGIVELDGDRLLGIATAMEGHPDNVAPALFGGLTIAWTGPNGPQHKRLLPHRSVSPLVLVPEQTMSTALARSLQPENVPHADAIFNVSRSTLLIAALIQSPELLAHRDGGPPPPVVPRERDARDRPADHAAARRGPRRRGLRGRAVDPRALQRPVAAPRRGGPRDGQRGAAVDRPAPGRGYQGCYARTAAGIRARPLLTVGMERLPAESEAGAA